MASEKNEKIKELLRRKGLCREDQLGDRAAKIALLLTHARLTRHSLLNILIEDGRLVICTAGGSITASEDLRSFERYTGTPAGPLPGRNETGHILKV